MKNGGDPNTFTCLLPFNEQYLDPVLPCGTTTKALEGGNATQYLANYVIRSSNFDNSV